MYKLPLAPHKELACSVAHYLDGIVHDGDNLNSTDGGNMAVALHCSSDQTE